MISRKAPYWDRVAFHTYVQSNGCHIFTGTLDRCGYGRIGKDNKYPRVHREVWKKHHGDIPPMMCVCHSCDNPACINVDHLFLGTHAENMADRARKGRYNNHGEKNPSAKLSVEQVRRIKSLLAEGATRADLGRTFGVTEGMIGHIKFNRAWV